MLLLLCLTLFAGAIFTSSNGCDIGPLPFTNFDFNKYNGQWIWLYYTKSDVFSTIGCILDVNIPQGDESVTITVSYNRVQKRNQVIKGFVREWNSTGYSHEYDNISAHIYVGFRMMNPNEDAIEAANKTLQENGMSLKDLGRFSDCDESWKLLGVES
ncbi:uncharacterized protein [Periplaneta americana]|uniref:uncharacterized protein isoform X3 n=1 Tax=Periplaneta americana TaxID=6978 RepID=UPI0037E9BE39